MLASIVYNCITQIKNKNKNKYKKTKTGLWVIVLNDTYISAISWRSVLLVEYGGWSMVFSQSLPRVVGSRVQGPTTLGRDWVFSVYSAYRENHHPATSHWQTLSHNVESNTPCLSGIQTVIYIFSVITISIRLFLYYILILFWIPYNNITERSDLH